MNSIMTVAASLLIAASVVLIGYGFFHIGLAVGKRRYSPKIKLEETKKSEDKDTVTISGLDTPTESRITNHKT
jgi:hypothetical protein